MEIRHLLLRTREEALEAKANSHDTLKG